MEKTRNALESVAGKLQQTRQLWRPGHIWEDIIKVNLKK
jgi:hypothetical protein